MKSSIQKVLPGSELMAFEISPDGKQIAYTLQSEKPRKLNIRDLTTGKEQVISIYGVGKYDNQVGWIEWSPDGNEIVFHSELDEYIRVYHLDLRTGFLRYINYFLEGECYLIDWIPSVSLRFICQPNNKVIDIDIYTGERTEIGTVTPTP
jgi:Tol biopolymer transport system component